MGLKKIISVNTNLFFNSKELINFFLQGYVFYYFFGHLLYINELPAIRTKEQIIITCICGIICQILYTTTKQVYYGLGIIIAWYSLYYINPAVNSAGYPFLAIFLLCKFLVDSDLLKPKHRLIVIESFIVFLSLYYFFTGYYKMILPEWGSGEALTSILRVPMARNWLASYVQNNLNLKILSYLEVFIYSFEMSVIFLIIKKLRFFLIIMLLFFHLMLTLSLSVLQLTVPYFILLLWLLQFERDRRLTAQHKPHEL